jgi:hypothetical protein
MMKIVLFMKEYTGLHIELQKSCSHNMTLPHQCAKYHLSTENNKQQTNYQYLSWKDKRFLFFQ